MPRLWRGAPERVELRDVSEVLESPGTSTLEKPLRSSGTCQARAPRTVPRSAFLSEVVCVEAASRASRKRLRWRRRRDSTRAARSPPWVDAVQGERRGIQPHPRRTGQHLHQPQDPGCRTAVNTFEFLGACGAMRHPPARKRRERSSAEEEGFEPPVELPQRRFSKPLPSTTRPLLRTGWFWPDATHGSRTSSSTLGLAPGDAKPSPGLPDRVTAETLRRPASR